MDYKICSVFAIFFVIINVCGMVIAEEAAPEMTCKQMVSGLMKRQLGGITKCTKQLKFKSGKEKAEKMTCILKCVMQNEGLLAADGKLTKESFDSFIKKELPVSMQERGIPILENCRATTSDGLDPNEPMCKTYDPLVKCFMGAVMQICP